MVKTSTTQKMQRRPHFFHLVSLLWVSLLWNWAELQVITHLRISSISEPWNLLYWEHREKKRGLVSINLRKARVSGLKCCGLFKYKPEIKRRKLSELKVALLCIEQASEHQTKIGKEWWRYVLPSQGLHQSPLIWDWWSPWEGETYLHLSFPAFIWCSEICFLLFRTYWTSSTCPVHC